MDKKPRRTGKDKKKGRTEHGRGPDVEVADRFQTHCGRVAQGQKALT